jgi:3-phenylpropionate/trans-cinnamate dioxygenase ferredoxin subunit
MGTGSWHNVVAVGAFPEEGKLAASVSGWNVLLVSDGTGFFAYNDVCSHQASRLSTGRVRRGSIMCPLHGARFRIENGECLGGAYSPLRQFPLRIEAGMIMVELPDRLPGTGEAPLD